MKKRVKRKGRRSVIEKNTADFNKEFGSQPRRGLGEKKTEGSPLAATETSVSFTAR